MAKLISPILESARRSFDAAVASFATGEKSHSGGGAREGSGNKAGESNTAWVDLDEESAHEIGLGWGGCKLCGEKGAVSFNGSTRNPRSFISSVERFRRRHQCSRPRSACKCEDECKCKSEKCKCGGKCKWKCLSDFVIG